MDQWSLGKLIEEMERKQQIYIKRANGVSSFSDLVDWVRVVVKHGAKMLIASNIRAFYEEKADANRLCIQAIKQVERDAK